MSNNKRIRLDDPSVPTASTLIGLLLYGMQGGQAVKVLPTLLKGMDGEDGVDGASAYEVAKANGFVGTQAEWLESLRGRDGAAGNKIVGVSIVGDDLVYHMDEGADITLSNGRTLLRGEKGTTVTSASFVDNDLVFTLSDNSSVAVVNAKSILKGDKGEKGDKGDKGDTGEKGDQGEKGDTGIGIPIGGTTGQQLMKKSNVDYDFEWQTPAGSGDMLKSVYDLDGNGIVDNAEKVGGFTVGTDVPENAKFTDTTYSEITEAEINTGTDSTLRTITARRVTFILGKVQTLISNAVSALTKASVGLGNVDNTSDANKPVSTAQQTALDAKIDANKFQVVAELPASPATGVFYFVKE